MSEKILLVSPDKGIPNLALMKISAWHKSQGDIVMPLNCFIEIPNADKIYVSCIFPNNMQFVPHLPPEKTMYGGSGYDFVVENERFVRKHTSTLPEQMEHLKPDYSLYNLDYSTGFTSRGCIRQCEWCLVPNLEGKIRPTNDIYEFLEPKFDTTRILDNNPLSLHDHFITIGEQLIKEKQFVIFDGLDARVLIDKTTAILAKLKTKSEKLKFALDAYQYIDEVETGIQMLIKHNAMHKTLWYLLLDFGEPIEQELARIKTLMKYNASIYPMFYNNKWKEMDKLLKNYPLREVLKMRTDNRIYRRLMRYLCYKLGFYDKQRREVDDKRLIAFQEVTYAELGWKDARFIGQEKLKELIKERQEEKKDGRE